MRTKAKVPVVTSASKGDWPYLRLDVSATAVYSLAFRHSDSSEALRDYTMPPIRL
jgi:hypothetical protein